MTTLLTSLPGDIPGLLRRKAPVRVDRWHEISADSYDATREDCLCDGSVLAIVGRAYHVTWLANDIISDGSELLEAGVLALDLTDPTGRAHAAWWCTGQNEDAFGRAIEALPGGLFAARAVYDAAFGGADMTPTQIDTLARLVLRLAGRAA